MMGMMFSASLQNCHVIAVDSFIAEAVTEQSSDI